VQLLVRQLGAQGGIAITASHNPPEWNALKFVGSDGLFLGAARGRELLDLYHQGDYRKARGGDQRMPEPVEDAIGRHVAAVRRALGALPAGARPFRVVVDPGGGAAFEAAPRLVEALGARVSAIHTTADGRFPRPAEPVPENLGPLAEAVRGASADVGFAQDMDGDRLAIVDETGRAIGEELTLVLAADHALGLRPGPLVTNVSTTDAVDVLAARHGIPVFRTRVGEANVADGMRLHGAPVGGEGNGGVIWPAVNFARDSLVGMALVLHRLAATGRAVSALAAEYDRYRTVKLQRHVPAEQARAILRRARDAWPGRPVDTTDGVKVRLDDGWFIVRASNTEPIVRVMAEGPTDARAREIAEGVLAEVAHWME
jgi:phosphomannomutase